MHGCFVEAERMHVTEYRNVSDLIKNKGKYAGFISIGPTPFEKNVLLRLHMRFSAKLVVRDSFVPSYENHTKRGLMSNPWGWASGLFS